MLSPKDIGIALLITLSTKLLADTYARYNNGIAKFKYVFRVLVRYHGIFPFVTKLIQLLSWKASLVGASIQHPRNSSGVYLSPQRLDGLLRTKIFS